MNLSELRPARSQLGRLVGSLLVISNNNNNNRAQGGAPAITGSFTLVTASLIVPLQLECLRKCAQIFRFKSFVRSPLVLRRSRKVDTRCRDAPSTV